MKTSPRTVGDVVLANSCSTSDARIAENDVEAEIHETRGAGSREGVPGLKAELIGGCAVNNRAVTLAGGL